MVVDLKQSTSRRLRLHAPRAPRAATPDGRRKVFGASLLGPRFLHPAHAPDEEGETKTEARADHERNQKSVKTLHRRLYIGRLRSGKAIHSLCACGGLSARATKNSNLRAVYSAKPCLGGLWPKQGTQHAPEKVDTAEILATYANSYLRDDGMVMIETSPGHFVSHTVLASMGRMAAKSNKDTGIVVRRSRRRASYSAALRAFHCA